MQDALDHPNDCGKLRLHLECFGLAGCMLAGRISRRLAINAAKRHALTVCLSRIERLRRRAVRAYVRAKGRRGYVQASQVWRQFVRWVRTNVLRKARTKLGFFNTKRHRQYVQLAMQAATRELKKRGETVPAADELRAIVRSAFRRSRRSGTAPSVSAMISKPVGAHFLAWLVVKKTGGEPEKTKVDDGSSVLTVTRDAPDTETWPAPQPTFTEVVTVRTPKLRALDIVQRHPLFQRLNHSFRKLDLVERASCVFEICQAGKRLARALARALKIDPKTIRRDLRVASLSDELKEAIRDGMSINEALRLATAVPCKQVVLSTEEKVDQLRNEIVTFFECRAPDIGAQNTATMLSDVMDEIELLDISGELGRRKRSRMNVCDLIRYTRPRAPLDFSDLTKWYPRLGAWLLGWVTRREPDCNVLNQAMVKSKKYFSEKPAHLPPFDVVARGLEDATREQLVMMDAIRRCGVDVMRDPRSITDPDVYASQRQREKEEAAAAYERELEQKRALLSGEIQPIRRNLSKPMTIGEERERQQEKQQELGEARKENIRARMGWAGPKPDVAEAAAQPTNQTKEVA
jgi:hypothetical protein